MKLNIKQKDVICTVGAIVGSTIGVIGGQKFLENRKRSKELKKKNKEFFEKLEKLREYEEETEKD